MKIITLWQPWASMIPLGLKRYETRSWATDYRGPLLIHAAKRPVDTKGAIVWTQVLELAKKEDLPKASIGFNTGKVHVDLPVGAVLAIGELTGCFEMIETKPVAPIVSRPTVAIDSQTELELAVGDWQVGRFAWKLENIRSLDPILWKGAQGLRNAPQALIDLVEQQQVTQS